MTAGAGRVADEIGVDAKNQLNGDAQMAGYEIVVGPVSSENIVASANLVIEEARGLDGEIGMDTAHQVIEEPVGVAGNFEVDAALQVTGEPAGVGEKIGIAAENQVSGNSVGVDVDIEVASGSHVTGETKHMDGEVEVASASQVTEETAGVCGENGVASTTLVAEETESVGGENRVISSTPLDKETEVLCGENGVGSTNQVAGETGGVGGETVVTSVNQITVELGDEGGNTRVPAGNHTTETEEAGALDCENGVTSVNKVNGGSGCGGGEIRVASANLGNEEPRGWGGEYRAASANNVNIEPRSEGREFRVASTDQVNRVPGGAYGESLVVSSKQVNGVAERVGGGELGIGEKHRWSEIKVYRRRPKVEKNKCVLTDLTATTSTTVVMDNGNNSKHNKLDILNTHESNHTDEVNVNHNSNQADENRVLETATVFSVPATGDSVKFDQIIPETMGEEIVSKDLISVREDSVTPIPVDQSVTNGALRPPYSAIDSKVKINLSSTAELELRQLKRKFESELHYVRKAMKNMNGSREEVVPEFFHPVLGSNVIPNGARSNGFATQVYSGTRSLGHVPYKHNFRPFNQLRVSVAENGHSMIDSIEGEKRTPKANQFYRNSEFLLANDKFPPAESNKKSKSNGKKSGGDIGFGVGSKVYKSCSALLEKLMKDKHGWVFNAPVDVKGLGLHDYFLIIKNPMDLGTVKAKLIKYWYKSPMEFAEDVRLTFHNAMLYNPKGNDVHIMAETLLRIFEGKWPDIEVKYLRELRLAVEPDIGYPTPTSRITNPFQLPALPPLETRVFNRSESLPHPINPKPRTLTPAPSFRAPALKKPKAKDINKRDMTYDEKQKLSTNLQSLPPEKLDGVIQIIKKRSTALSQNDDEIEVDIDSVDTETLWDLDRFASNYRKSLSKIRRKAELVNQMRAIARQTAEKTTTPQLIPPKESTAGYGNATLSLPPRQNDPASNPSGSSSSSSSSSSGSSSSDSDGDSSSEESDRGHSHAT